MSGAIHPLPQYAFMVWYLVKHRDNFIMNKNERNEGLPSKLREEKRHLP
jgi:hypothetical protein